jgi:hypothetical protein
VFSGVSSVCTRDAQGPEDCELEVSLMEEVYTVGNKGSGNNTTVEVGTFLWKLLDLGIFSTTAGISEFLEYQFLDSRNSTVHIYVYME